MAGIARTITASDPCTFAAKAAYGPHDDCTSETMNFGRFWGTIGAETRTLGLVG
jgi:hypothetical protein